jgi:predicted RNA-binding protein
MAKAYLKHGPNKEIFLEEVASINSKGERLFLKPLFGEEKSLIAAIKEIDFVNSIILLEKETSQEKKTE